jgi:hypothetical protein
MAEVKWQPQSPQISRGRRLPLSVEGSRNTLGVPLVYRKVSLGIMMLVEKPPPEYRLQLVQWQRTTWVEEGLCQD